MSIESIGALYRSEYYEQKQEKLGLNLSYKSSADHVTSFCASQESICSKLRFGTYIIQALLFQF